MEHKTDTVKFKVFQGWDLKNSEGIELSAKYADYTKLNEAHFEI